MGSAVQQRNRAVLGGRYIELFPSNEQEAARGCGVTIAGDGPSPGYGPVPSQQAGLPVRSHPYGAGMQSPQPQVAIAGGYGYGYGPYSRAQVVGGWGTFPSGIAGAPYDS